MNERIRELSLQSMTIVMNGSDPDGDIDKMYIPSEFINKFAELIIRECARAVDRVYETSEPDHGCYDWATWAYGSDVLAHFELDKPA